MEPQPDRYWVDTSCDHPTILRRLNFVDEVWVPGEGWAPARGALLRVTLLGEGHWGSIDEVDEATAREVCPEAFDLPPSSDS